jgi:hypothetical protein
MLRWRLWTTEEGSASLEFVTVGMILLVPLIYLIVTLAALQSASFAVEGATRQAVRVFIQSPTVVVAQSEAQRAVDYALADYGISPSDAHVHVSCSPTPTDCLRRLGRVTVMVDTAVTLPLVPSVLTLHLPLEVPISASSTQVVSRFGGEQ